MTSNELIYRTLRYLTEFEKNENLRLLREITDRDLINYGEIRISMSEGFKLHHDEQIREECEKLGLDYDWIDIVRYRENTSKLFALIQNILKTRLVSCTIDNAQDILCDLQSRLEDMEYKLHTQYNSSN